MFYLKVDCPYCGAPNKLDVGHQERHRIVTCDVEEVPGCDQEFFVQFKFNAHATVKKIEGYDDSVYEQRLEEQQSCEEARNER